MYEQPEMLKAESPGMMGNLFGAFSKYLPSTEARLTRSKEKMVQLHTTDVKKGERQRIPSAPSFWNCHLPFPCRPVSLEQKALGDHS